MFIFLIFILININIKFIFKIIFLIFNSIILLMDNTINELKDNVNDLSKKNLLIYLNLLYEKWVLNLNINDIENFFINNLHIINFYDIDEITDSFNNIICEVIKLQLIFAKKKISMPMDNDDTYFMKFNKILELLYYGQKLFLTKIRINTIKDPNYESFMNDDIDISKFSQPDYNNNTPYQNLILYLLYTLDSKNYRRYNGDCEIPIFNKKGQYTYAWKKKTTLEDFVYKHTRKEINYDQWKNLTASKDNARHSVEFLKKCQDSQFKEIHKDRHVFSFNNGLLICNYKYYDEENESSYISEYFLNYDDFNDYYNKKNKKNIKNKSNKNSSKSNNINNTENLSNTTDEDILENTNEDILEDNKYKIDKDIIACKYFDTDLMYSKVDNWNEVETPILQSIIDYQFSNDAEYKSISKWMYILIGRMIYNLNELEYWQIIVFLKGMAGTGKSTIITKVVKEFYEYDDVGQLSNDGEKTFGLSAFCDKKIFIAPEIKADFSLPQAVFQGIISGEDVSIAKKYKTAETIEWKIPGFMAGNEIPNFTDNSGSISRRLVVFDFLKKVKKDKSDPLLGKKLKKEIPYIIRKSNLAYLDAVGKYGKKDIWLDLPSYFKKTQEQISEKTNSLSSFLNSGMVSYNKDFYIHEKIFKSKFNTYCKENNLGLKKFNSDFYNGPYLDASEKNGVPINVLIKKKKKYPRNSYGKLVHGNFITGLDIFEDEDDEDDDDNDDEDD